MIFSLHCYNHQWRQEMWVTHIQAAKDIDVSDQDRVGLSTIKTAEDLLAADFDDETLSEAFAELSLVEQARFLDLRELDCPWPIIGLEH